MTSAAFVTRPNQPPYQQKPSSTMTPFVFPPHFWGDFFYLAHRIVVILCSIVLLGIFGKADTPETPIPPPEISCSDSVTAQNFTQIAPDPEQHAALVQKVHGELRMLRLVIERLPKHFIPYQHWPQYKLTYYVEKLECGHEQFYFPQAGPMSKRRKCAQCAFEATLPEKKPAVSVEISAEKEKNA